MKGIILADDHAIFREAMKSVLSSHGYEIAGEADSFSQLELLLGEINADILICDCSMPGGSPLSSYPKVSLLQSELKVIYLTGVESGFLFQQLEALGVSAIVCTGPSELLSKKEFQVLESAWCGTWRHSSSVDIIPF